MTDWMDRAACKDLPVAVFQPEYDPDQQRYVYSDGQQAAAKAVCAGCPVVRQCLIADLPHVPIYQASASGMRGGVGGLGRRRLIVAMRDVDHPPEKECRDPECAWCEALRDHTKNLDVVAGRRPRDQHVTIDGNGPGATHGRKSTYARGCRCGPCRLAMSAKGQDLAADGVDLVKWWDINLEPLEEGDGPANTGEWVEVEEWLSEYVVDRAKHWATRKLRHRELDRYLGWTWEHVPEWDVAS